MNNYNLIKELRILLDETSERLRMREWDVSQLELVHKELDRLGIPRKNEHGGCCTPYGRLRRVTNVEFE